MSRLFETIKIQNGKPQNVEWHLRRVSKSRSKLYGCCHIQDFQKFLNDFSIQDKRINKLKIIYDQEIVYYEFSHYKIINKKTIKFIECPELNYSYKFVDRTIFEEIEKKLKPEEIAIITQNGYLTDATYANIVLSDGINYYTPENCLLKGTKRSKLLKEGRIVSKLIHIDELGLYKKLQIINSMIDLEDDFQISL